MADWVLGKWPRALTARRYLALRDSMALVEQMTLRTPASWSRKGTNSLQAFRHSRIIAGYFLPHAWSRASSAARAAFSLLAV